MKDTFRCPHCYAEIDIDSVVCKYCGADDKTAWSANTLYDGIDLPEPEELPLRNFWKTQLGKDLKYFVLILLLLAFVGFIFKF